MDSSMKAKDANSKDMEIDTTYSDSEQGFGKISQLPLEKKLELLKKYNHMEYYQPEKYVDALDTVNSWCLAEIVDNDNKTLQIHFDGWSNKWDIVNLLIRISFSTIRSHLQKWLPLESIPEDILARAKSPQENRISAQKNQKMGKLYIYVDFLLGAIQYSEEQIAQINVFLYTVINLIVAWQKKMPELLGFVIKTWLTLQFSQIKVNQDLYLIDEKIALIQCYHEFFDILKKLFCCCHRCVKYYYFCDLNVIASENQITQNFDLNFIERRMPNEDTYDLDEVKQQMYQQKNMQNIKCKSIGFLLIEKGNSSEEKMPIEIISYMTNVFKNCNQVMSQEFKKSLVNQVKDCLFKRIQNMNEKELKEIDKEILGRVLIDFKDFLNLALEENETSQLIEEHQLLIALRFLKSTYLEKRLRGLNDLKSILDRVEFGQKQMLIKAQGKMIDQSMVPGQPRIRPMKWLQADYMKKWILDQQVLETVFGENTHLEIVKRSGCLLKFLSKNDALPPQTIDLIWKCQLGKHEEMVRVVYQIIKDLIPYISLDLIDMIQSKIMSVPAKNFDEKFLDFLKDFTLKALENYYHVKNNDAMNNESNLDSFDKICIKKEIEIISQLDDNFISHCKTLAEQQKNFGLLTLWEIVQDKSTIQSKELIDFALASIEEIFESQQFISLRIFYLLRCLENLKKRESFYQSLSLLEKIIKTYPMQNYNMEVQQLTSSNFIKFLQQKVQIIELIVQNLEIYHKQVQQKLKQLGDKSGALPENLADSVIVGKYAHNQLLIKVLEYLEYLILSSNLHVSLGNKNIDSLWQIFVHQPNFNSDQTIFLKWINKQRDQEFNQQELSIFKDDEKRHFFVNILCNPTFIEFKKISIGQVKSFHKYFKIINFQQRFIELYKNSLIVVQFDQLIGIDSLWKICLVNENEKIIEESMELLVDLHIKHNRDIALNIQVEIWYKFINKCMSEISLQGGKSTKSAIKLISKFFDRYDGKRPLKPELKLNQHFQNIQPCNIPIFNTISNTKKNIQISYFLTVGHLRRMIAEEFNLALNEFVIIYKNYQMDQDNDDDRYIKDFGQIQQLIVSKNQRYSAENHPKKIISENQEHFEKIFNILNSNQTDLIEPVWGLLSKIPVSQKLQKEIFELNGIKNDTNNWKSILDPKSAPRLLYCLKIIQQITGITNNTKKINVQWTKQFIDLGGFKQLIDAFINLQMNTIENSLSLTCIENLLIVINEFINLQESLLQDIFEVKEKFIMKSIEYISLITQYSIKCEENRGESFEDVNKRISANKQKKNKYKSYMQGNKGIGPQQNDKKSQQNNLDDDDDSESIDFQLQQQIIKAFQEQSHLVKNLFKFISNSIIQNQSDAVKIFPNYPKLNDFLFNAIVKSENIILRQDMSQKMKELILTRKDPNEKKEMIKIVNIFLFHIEPMTIQYETRCQNFYDSLSQIIEQLDQDDFAPLQQQISTLLNSLSNQIIEREIKEKNAQDLDSLLIGKMKLLKVLLQKFPTFKEQIGQKLTDYLIHQCLFQIPHGSQNKTSKGISAPKCKNQNSRQGASKLLDVLCRDNINNLNRVLQYMKSFNKNQTWRTNKEHDWNICPRDSEKSQTGYVGIKNLGCICYMNSLFQQLFMIPSFRYDILNVQNAMQLSNQEREEDMLFQLQVLFTGLLKSEKQYINPKGFCHSFKDWDGNPTNVLEQMDADEFFSMFMDRIETAIKGSQFENTVQKHFGGKFTHEMICKDCPHTYERQEPYLQIGIQAKNKKSLYEGLDTFVLGDMLEGENAYYCEKCDKKVDTLKRCSIKYLPKYLMIALKRFEFDFDKMIRVKVNDYCEFPQELNMEPYTQEGLARREKQQKEEEQKQDEGMTITEEKLKYPKEYYEYTLSGVVVHTGTADSGHYYSFIKDKDNPDNGKWYEMNDSIVRDFDTSDIPNECFGGEETFQGYNMMQMKSMKWRNAYLVLYERKLKDDIEFDEDDQIKKTEDTKMQIQQLTNNDIEQKIAYENQKYWQNKFLFGNEYSELVQNISLYWNTSCVIPKQYLSKNDNFKQSNEQIPPEYLFDKNILEPMDVCLKLGNQFSQEHIENIELEVFKFTAGFYVAILQRASNKQHLPQMLNNLKSYLNKSYECANWFLSEFCNEKIIDESLVQSQPKEMRKFMVGLIYCAMLKIYPQQKDLLLQYFQDPQSVKKCTLANFALILIKGMFNMKQFQLCNSQYFQLLARIAILGQEAREFLLRCNMVGRLMDYFFDDASPYSKEFRNMSQINPVYKEQPDIGLPTSIDRKQMNYFQEIIERRRIKAMQEAHPKYKYIIETLSLLIRNIQFGNEQSPYQIGQSLYKLLSQENDIFNPEAKFLKRIFFESKNSRAIEAICKCYSHFAWNEQDKLLELTSTMIQGMNEADYDDVRVFQYILYFCLNQNKNQHKVNHLMKSYMEAVHNNHQFYKYMESQIEFILKIASRLPQARDWFANNKPIWQWIIEWIKEYKLPPNNLNGPIKMFKKRNSSNYMNIHQMQRQDNIKNQALFHLRMKRLQQLYEGQVQDLSNEIDPDLSDMQDYHFCVGDKFDIYNRKYDRIMSFVVEQVLDEMVRAKLISQNSQMMEGMNQANWNTKDSQKLLLGGEYQKMMRTKLFDQIYKQIEAQMKMQYQQQPSQDNMSDDDGSDDDNA